MRISDWSSDVLFRLDFNAVEGDVARETRVDEAAGVRGQPPRILWHREQGDAAVGPGRDDAHVGDMAVEDEAFPAVETKAVARSEERRVGKECDSTFRSRWSPSN